MIERWKAGWTEKKYSAVQVALYLVFLEAVGWLVRYALTHP